MTNRGNGRWSHSNHIRPAVGRWLPSSPIKGRTPLFSLRCVSTSPHDAFVLNNGLRRIVEESKEEIGQLAECGCSPPCFILVLATKSLSLSRERLPRKKYPLVQASLLIVIRQHVSDRCQRRENVSDRTAQWDALLSATVLVVEELLKVLAKAL